MALSVCNLPHHQHVESSFISCLFIEYDIPNTIFSYLRPSDLLNAELVCHTWRSLIMAEKIWEKKLHFLYNSDLSWQNLLNQHGWKELSLSHIVCKGLYLDVLLKLGPSHVTGKFAKVILNDILYNEHNLTGFKDFEESKYLNTGLLKNRKPLMEITNSKNEMCFNEGFRELILTGPTSFPVIVTSKSAVVVAATTYGKGRVVVMGHEALLRETRFVQHLADWCARRTKCPITEDSMQGFWRNGWRTQNATVKKPRRALSRKQLNNDTPVFITDAHHDNDREHLLDYVKRGGGLIIAGHACWQLSQLPNHCGLLEHPGNRITAPMGIIFSSTYVMVSSLSLDQGKLPGLKHSLYYMLKCISRISVPLVRNFITTLEYKGLSSQVREIVTWRNKLSTVDHFKDLLKILEVCRFRLEKV